ncbi:hypothetical protein KEM55_008096 [Ascosphaera atra]|nr:hypothetical protein KEM55_008096 [Ascosphaera atra]
MENTSASAGSTSTVSSSAATFGKRWRDKLRNKDKKNDKPSLDAVVNDFLGAHRRGQTSQGGNADAPSGPPPYDVANYVPKAPRRPGLQVSFSLQPPAIIGEGGDDCEIPTAHLATTRRPSPKEEEKRPSDADRVSEDNNAQPSVVVSGGANDELGFDDSWRPPLTSDTTLLRALSSAGTGSRRTRLSMRVDDETADLARKIRAKMMEEEGRALHQKPPEVEEDTTGRSTENKDPPKDGDGNIIAAPQPRRVFTYRPSEESANLETLEKRSAEHEQQSPFRDSASSGEDGGAHIQNIISHLRDEDSSQLDSPTFETASERDHAPEPQPELEHKHTLPYRSPENFEPPSQPVPSSPPRLPAFNPLDLSMSTSPRRRANDRPVSPIKPMRPGKKEGFVSRRL